MFLNLISILFGNMSLVYLCIQFMRTNISHIFGAGDITSFPLTIRGEQRVNIGHWQMSQAHGKTLKKQKMILCALVGSFRFYKC